MVAKSYDGGTPRGVNREIKFGESPPMLKSSTENLKKTSVNSFSFMGKNFVSDGTFCTTFCTKKPKNKNCRPLTQCGHVRLILGLFYFQILVLQCKINFQVIA